MLVRRVAQASRATARGLSARACTGNSAAPLVVAGGALACGALYAAQPAARAEGNDAAAVAAKTRFDAKRFGSPRYDGDVVVVTGGSTGIGAACCRHVVAAGGKVYSVDFKPPPVPAPGVTHIQCNVSDVSAVREAIGGIVAADGRIDVLVSNAGVWHGGDFEKTEEADFDRIVGVNLKGTFFAIQACVPAMRESGGAIVLIGSDQSLVGKPEQHLYGCTKGAIAQLSKSLAAHYAPQGIRVNCVQDPRLLVEEARARADPFPSTGLPGHDRHAAHAQRGTGLRRHEGRQKGGSLRLAPYGPAAAPHGPSRGGRRARRLHRQDPFLRRRHRLRRRRLHRPVGYLGF